MTIAIMALSVAVISLLIIAAPLVLAAVVFSLCSLLGIDPGPAGDRLRDLVRDVLRLYR